MPERSNTVVFVGGGTLGSVTPLLAVYEELRVRGGYSFRWIGTRSGPEAALVSDYGIPFTAIFAARLRRYVSLRTLAAPFEFIVGFLQSLRLLRGWHPRVIISAGSFVAVPVLWAGRALGIPSVIIQLDSRTLLANRVTQGCAQKICLAYPNFGAEGLDAKKTVVTGIPVRRICLDAARSIEDPEARTRALGERGFEPGVPLVAIVGGGTGAAALNTLVVQSLPQLLPVCQIIHQTGKGKGISGPSHARYRQFETFGDDPLILRDFALADVVVTRAGMGALSEFAVLGLALITVAYPNSPQENNAAHFARAGAAFVLSQQNITPEKFAAAVKKLLGNATRRESLRQNIRTLATPDAAAKVADIIERV